MSLYSADARMQALGFVAAAAGGAACAWLLLRRGDRTVVIDAGGPQWQQVTPPDAAAAVADKHGETNLQAKFVSQRLSAGSMQQRADALFRLMNTRRTMRFYSTDVPPEGVVETCIATAGTMPSGAHHQPWFFVMVRDAGLKMQIQELVEEEERVNYERRMRKSWIEDLSVMTGENADPRLRSADNSAPKKPYLSQAPILIALFKQSHSVGSDGQKSDNYYVQESCGIAAGMLIASLHNVGLATLPSTPMGAEVRIRDMLGRPDSEKLLLLMPVGYPATDATVPYRTPLRKSFEGLLSKC